MDLALSTPALLFPAISLLFLAYTNRFLHLAALIRKLHSDHLAGNDPCAKEQILNLHRRLSLIRWMQIWGVASLLGCTLAMVCLFFGWGSTGSMVFVASVLAMTVSLALSLREIFISGGALAILLAQLENSPRAKS
ncbi:DUF2721 domain-containing protein [Synoicihabitans lomoniglobus]|uniref:DUF2721 domain-containing protein n=1 Tax=Synoicihabitans lomoniglobus TaxID=2909285 RepID=A0AAE9ZW01_9BACT|nr:DUF2721 domain-containing protein [Opitutaceae bacterium LMO-M01]WED64194.1 DUF2721 domain-containing protein [Opitutaceae bacterium LMO-M01]